MTCGVAPAATAASPMFYRRLRGCCKPLLQQVNYHQVKLGLGPLLSGSAQFYRTTWTLSLVGGNLDLYAGYWIRTGVIINTPDGTLRVPFRLDFE